LNGLRAAITASSSSPPQPFEEIYQIKN